MNTKLCMFCNSPNPNGETICDTCLPPPAPTKLRLVEQKSDIRETLEPLVSIADSMDGVMVLGINKDGTQFLVSSTMSHYQKCFLLAFHQAVNQRWFDEMADLK